MCYYICITHTFFEYTRFYFILKYMMVLFFQFNYVTYLFYNDISLSVPFTLLVKFRTFTTVDADNVIINDINMNPSGDGIQFNFYVLDEQQGFVLVLEDLMAALNVRN